MPQFFVHPEPGASTCTITGDDFTHLTRVRRVGEGDKLMVRTGDGTGYRSRILKVSHDHIEVELIDKLQEDEHQGTVVLYMALLKGKALEMVIQKAVEVGVAGIVPMQTERSVVQLKSLNSSRLERWRKIAQEASKQCLRSSVASVGEPLDFSMAIEQAAGEKILAHPGEREFSSSPEHHEYSLFIGPEGGFSHSEVEVFRQNGGQVASFGNNHLRAETAGVVLPALLLHEMRHQE